MYLLAEPERYVNGIVKLTPLWYRERMMTILSRIDKTLRAWISVTAVSMVVVAILTGLGLALLGIREWLAGRIGWRAVVYPQLRSSCCPYPVSSSGIGASAAECRLDHCCYLRRVVFSESSRKPGAG